MYRKPLLLLVLLLLPATASAQAEQATGNLKLRVVDAATKRPLPTRVSLQAADGSFPGDRIALLKSKWPNVEAHGVFISGEHTFELPPGKTLLQISHGPQYKVDRREVEIVAGKTSELAVTLQRAIDLRKLGWVAGDAHLHMIHGEMQRATSYEDVAITCRANGLDWAYINQEYAGAGEKSLQDFHDACAKVSDRDFQMFIGGERPKSLLGHNALIGVANPFVIPDDPPYHRAAEAIHAQGGVLFPVHPLRYFPGKQYLGEWLDFPGNNLGREIIFDAFLGPSFDGLSVLSDEPNDQRAHALWFNLLNRGLFVPALADSDACFDRPVLHKNVPGFWNTFLYVGPDSESNNASLAQAVRAGRTMATTGPIVLWDVDGKLSGDTLPLDGATHKVTITASHAYHNWTLDEARVAKVELLRNGKVVRVWEPNTPEAELTCEIHETEPCWYAVRVFGTDQRWQVALASPIYFRSEPASRKQRPLTVQVRGRVYDFKTGGDRQAQIVVKRHGKVLQEFAADGQFAVKVPLDASISAVAKNVETIDHNLLLDYGPVHRFLWKLDSEALSKPETFAQFEALASNVELEFPLGYRMPGCYAVQKLTEEITFKELKVVDGPASSDAGLSVAAVLLDKSSVTPGDTVNVAVLFHGAAASANVDPLLVLEGRAYDERHPTGFNPLKVFDTFESKWSQAADAGAGYRVITGKLKLPDWITPGPVDAIEINAIARGQGGKFASHLGMRLPLGATARELMVVSNWPSVPISWPDHNYGIGPLQVCGKIGRKGQPTIDYRRLKVKVRSSGGDFDISPASDCVGHPDADDAIFTGHFLDQVLNDESRLVPSISIRPQPKINWREMPYVDATESP